MTVGEALPFKLYPVEQRWWSGNDYRAVLETMERLRPQTVLEFGPGSSTLALIEGGAEHIDTCEDNPEWAKVYTARLANRFPKIVTLVEYVYDDPLHVPGVHQKTYDMALIDGPFTTPKRPLVIRYCLERCSAVLVPTEDDGRQHNSYLRPILMDLASEHGCDLSFMETGPLSGGFALLTRTT